MIIHLGNIQQGIRKKWEKLPYFSGSQAKQSKFSAELNQDQQWMILGERGVSAPVLRNNGSWYY